MRVARRELSPPRTDDEPRSWLRLTLSLLWDNLAVLVLLNLAGTLLAAPLILLGMAVGVVPLLFIAAVTVAPIIGGLAGAVSGEWRSQPGTMRQRFVTTVRTRSLPLAALGLIAGVCVGATALTTGAILSGDAGNGLLLLWPAQIVALTVAVMLLAYAVPLAAAHDLGPRLALRNALVLTAAAPLAAIGLLSGIVLLTALLVIIGPGMWLVVPVVGAVFATTNCEHQLERLRTRAGQA